MHACYIGLAFHLTRSGCKPLLIPSIPHSDINFSQLNEVGLIILAIIAFIGVTIFDIFYIVVIVTYVSQCQLLIYYIDNICERVKSSSVPFDVAIKVSTCCCCCGCHGSIVQYLHLQDIHNLRDFVKTLNGNISHIVSLLLFNFVSFSLSGMLVM